MAELSVVWKLTYFYAYFFLGAHSISGKKKKTTEQKNYWEFFAIVSLIFLGLAFGG